MRANKTLAVAAIVAAIVAAQAAAAQAPRLRIGLDDGWRYRAADSQGFDGPGGVAVKLPHTWNADDAFSADTSYRRGVGWYRRTLSLSSAYRGKRLFLYFAGANHSARVYVNATRVGEHVGGYTAFAFEITDHVRFDRPNVIAVRVDNGPDPAVPPITADFTFYGGIYRDVWLIVTDPVHIDVLDYASSGIYVDTPEIAADRATVRVRGTVINQRAEARPIDVVSRVVDRDGHDVARLAGRVRAAPGARTMFEYRSAPIAHPRLWSPDSPTLYHVITELADGGRVTDRVVVPLGFRWGAADATRGFTLNGGPHPLRGTNRHQDRAGLGNALPESAHRQDMALIKATGFNFVRLAHYPQDQAVLDAADSLGLVVWQEIPVVNQIATTEAFAATADRMLVEMVRQYYNHPAIMFWGYMNEVLLAEPKPVSVDYRRQVVALARRLDARAHWEDPTRQTAMAITADMIDNGTGIQDVPDVAGLNLYYGWYYGSVDRLGPALDAFHARHPTRPVIVSEYGAAGDDRLHTFAPSRYDFTTDYQQRFHERAFAQIVARPWLAGSAAWVAFDFGSKGRQDTRPNINNKGLFAFDRAPKDVAYYYRAMLAPEPVLRIATRDWPRRTGPTTQTVVVYSNRARVELFNGVTSLGAKPVVNATARWDVPLHAGDNRLRAAAAGIEDVATIDYAPTLAAHAGSYQYVDTAGTVWDTDHGFAGGTPNRSYHRLAGTSDDALFQATRDGVEGYHVDVPDGQYACELSFVETEHETTGERVFDVGVNGVPAVTGLDLAARYGRYVAVRLAVRVTVDQGQGVTVRFTPHIGVTTISAIRVYRINHS